MNYDVLSRKIEMLNNEYWILNFEIVIEPYKEYKGM
jgi:hypothetical protein